MESDIKYKYYCEYCGRVFERQYNLHRHLQNVHNRDLETVESVDDNDDAHDAQSNDSQDKDDTERDASMKSNESESDTVSNDE